MPTDGGLPTSVGREFSRPERVFDKHGWYVNGSGFTTNNSDVSPYQ